MKLFLKRACRSGTLFLTSQTGDEKPRAVGIVFLRPTNDGTFGWKAGDLADEITPHSSEESALSAMYERLGWAI
jgi:hypothetical protein